MKDEKNFLKLWKKKYVYVRRKEKESLFIRRKESICYKKKKQREILFQVKLFGFVGISTLDGYLMPNPAYIYIYIYIYIWVRNMLDKEKG